MHTHEHTYTYISMFTHILVHTYVHVLAFVYSYTCVHICLCIYTCPCANTSSCTQTYIHAHTFTYINTRAHIHSHIHIISSSHTCMCTHIHSMRIALGYASQKLSVPRTLLFGTYWACQIRVREEFYQTFKDSWPILLKLYKNQNKTKPTKGALSNVYAACIALITKPCRDTTRK